MDWHTLTITLDGPPTRYESRWGSHVEIPMRYSITCYPGGCNGWQECWEDHTGFDPDDEASPAFDAISGDEIEIHGVPHEWRDGWGWTVPYPGCVLAAQDLGDYAEDIGLEYGPGAYLVDDDWDDGEANISPISMADGSPLPEPGWSARQPGLT